MLLQFIVPAFEMLDPVQCIVDMSGMSTFGTPMVVASESANAGGAGPDSAGLDPEGNAKRRSRGIDRMLDGQGRRSACRSTRREAEAAQNENARQT